MWWISKKWRKFKILFWSNAYLKWANNENEEDDYKEKLNREKNEKYGDYPERMLEIINSFSNIRESKV